MQVSSHRSLSICMWLQSDFIVRPSDKAMHLQARNRQMKAIGHTWVASSAAAGRPSCPLSLAPQVNMKPFCVKAAL